jgi:hypothetical protein
MGWRFRQRITLAPGFTLNLSKSRPSLSVGVRGLRTTFGRGVRTTVGLPGSGLSYTTTHGARHRAAFSGLARGLGHLIFVGLVLWLVIRLAAG